MSIVRLIIIFFISSILFSNSIEYKIDENKMRFIDNHFVNNNSNAVIIKDDLVFDIYRLEFISDSNKKINFKINNIEWVKTNYKVDEKHLNDLVSINNSFNYKACPMMYVDIFPYKKDENNTLFYIKSIDIEFYVDQVEINNFCNVSDKVINKDFLFIKDSSSFNSRDIDYLVITNSDLFPAADILHTIHNDLNIEMANILMGVIYFVGILNVLDAVLLVNAVLDPGILNDAEFEAADFNSDDILNVLDVVSLINIILTP